jgi:hypothetical protein
MKKSLLFIISFVFAISAYTQEWTEPVKINMLQGLNNNPDFCIDKNGTLHCVWSYKIEQNHRIIYYSKSVDEGLTWSTPENLSQNTSLWMENPHIVIDSENNIHLTYDHNTGNPGGTLIVHCKFDGQNWSETDTVSTGWPGARHNRLVIDNNDKLYCFWFHEYQNGTTFYRILENDTWGEITIPYNNNDLIFFNKGIIDSFNNIRCTGSHHFFGQSGYDDRVIYFNFINRLWDEWVQLSDNTSWGGNDIALDSNNRPSLTWRQYTSNTIPPNDGTLFSKFDGINWSYPEIIVEDPSDQAIAIDKNNKVHIVDNEKFEEGYRLVHYQFVNEEWVGGVIEEDTYGNFDNKFVANEQYIYLLSGKVDTIIGSSSQTSIILRKLEISTNIENNFAPVFNSFIIYPNPSSGNTTISYTLKEAKHTEIKIYNLAGELLKTLSNKKQAPGKYQIKWNGTDKNGKEVISGLYLIRLQAGRQIMTRSVEIIK